MPFQLSLPLGERSCGTSINHKKPRCWSFVHTVMYLDGRNRMEVFRSVNCEWHCWLGGIIFSRRDKYLVGRIELWADVWHLTYEPEKKLCCKLGTAKPAHTNFPQSSATRQVGKKTIEQQTKKMILELLLFVILLILLFILVSINNNNSFSSALQRQVKQQQLEQQSNEAQKDKRKKATEPNNINSVMEELKEQMKTKEKEGTDFEDQMDQMKKTIERRENEMTELQSKVSDLVAQAFFSYFASLHTVLTCEGDSLLNSKTWRSILSESLRLVGSRFQSLWYVYDEGDTSQTEQSPEYQTNCILYTDLETTGLWSNELRENKSHIHLTLPSPCVTSGFVQFQMEHIFSNNIQWIYAIAKCLARPLNIERYFNHVLAMLEKVRMYACRELSISMKCTSLAKQWGDEEVLDREARWPSNSKWTAFFW